MKHCWIYFILFIFIAQTLPILSQTEQDYSSLLEDVLETTQTDDTLNNTDATSTLSNSKNKATVKLLGENSVYFTIPFYDNQELNSLAKQPLINQDLTLSLTYQFFSLQAGLRTSITFKPSLYHKVNVALTLQPLENFIAIQFPKMYFSLGYQTFFWGSAYKTNPVDRLNNLDTQYGIYRIEKIPILAANLEISPVRCLKIQTVYAPFFSESKNIFTVSQTAPERSIYQHQNILTNFFKEKNISLPEPADSSLLINPIDFSYPSIGTRISFFTPGIDLAFTYLYKPDAYPSVKLPSLRIPVSTNITINYKMSHHVGFDFSIPAKTATFWLESSAIIPVNWNLIEVRNPQVEFVLGFDYTFGKNDDMLINMQYYGKYYHFPEQSSVNQDSYYRILQPLLANINERYLQALFFHMQFPIIKTTKHANMKITPSLSLSYYLPGLSRLKLEQEKEKEKEYGSIWIHPQLSLTTLGSLEIAIGTEIYFSIYQMNDKIKLGNNSHNFGSFYKDTLAYIEVIYKWDVYK